MIRLRSSIVAASMALAIGVAASLLSAATPGAAPATTAAATTAATKVGSVSGKVVDKDGKPAAGAQVRFAAVATGTASAPAGGRGARGGAGRGGRGPAIAADDKGAFKLDNVPVGQVNITANLTAADGTRQTGTTATPVEVKEGVESKLPADIKLADAPARGGRGAGGAGGMTPPATASRPAGN